MEEKMSFEINIVSINQEIPVHINFNSQITVHNEIDNNEESRYTEIWPFFSNTKGILYSLVQEVSDGFYSSFPLCDSDFEISLSENSFPNWIPDEIKGDLTPFIVKENVYEDFVKIIHFLIDNAPQKRILFQTRYQCKDCEIVFGVIKIKKFFEMLNLKQIFFNVCYIIECD